MRLEYTLYLIAVIFFLITATSFALLQGLERNLWVVATVILGLFSLGLGYTQRLKARPSTAAVPPLTPEVPVTQPAQPVIETVKEEVEEAAEASAATVEQLRRVKGVGPKRAAQLMNIGISSVEELGKASAEELAAKLKISPKIAEKWIAKAKELVK
ncbi:MAG: helix-hairpin-helix domain-containing protein [Candidatus Bathycorpusculaceae bacterium]